MYTISAVSAATTHTAPTLSQHACLGGFLQYMLRMRRNSASHWPPPHQARECCFCPLVRESLGALGNSRGSTRLTRTRSSSTSRIIIRIRVCVAVEERPLVRNSGFFTVCCRRARRRAFTLSHRHHTHNRAYTQKKTIYHHPWPPLPPPNPLPIIVCTHSAGTIATKTTAHI